jgi:hypothetical protein
MYCLHNSKTVRILDSEENGIGVRCLPCLIQVGLPGILKLKTVGKDQSRISSRNRYNDTMDYSPILQQANTSLDTIQYQNRDWDFYRFANPISDNV